MHSPCCTSSPRRSASLASTSTRVGSPNTRWRCERRQDSHHGSRGVERVPTAPRTSRLPADDRAAEPLALVLDLARTERVSATQVREELLGVEVTMASRMLTIKRAARKRSDRLRPIDAYRCRRDFNGFHHACSRRHSNPIKQRLSTVAISSCWRCGGCAGPLSRSASSRGNHIRNSVPEQRGRSSWVGITDPRRSNSLAGDIASLGRPQMPPFTMREKPRLTRRGL